MENPLECAKVASNTQKGTLLGGVYEFATFYLQQITPSSLSLSIPPTPLSHSTNNGPRLMTESETNLTTDWPGAWLQFADPKSLSNDS